MDHRVSLARKERMRNETEKKEGGRGGGGGVDAKWRSVILGVGGSTKHSARSPRTRCGRGTPQPPPARQGGRGWSSPPARRRPWHRRAPRGRGRTCPPPPPQPRSGADQEASYSSFCLTPFLLPNAPPQKKRRGGGAPTCTPPSLPPFPTLFVCRLAESNATRPSRRTRSPNDPHACRFAPLPAHRTERRTTSTESHKGTSSSSSPTGRRRS